MRRLGIDCPDRLDWRNWVPGTEYIKHLVVKNVSTSTVTVKYKQTASRAFSMDFPEPIKLRPGMSAPLKVVRLANGVASMGCCAWSRLQIVSYAWLSFADHLQAAQDAAVF
jgi:hypothetical protein